MQPYHGAVTRYRKYFEKWDEVAAVRSKSNTYNLSNHQINAELKNRKWFLPNLLPMLSHPLLRNLDQEKEQYICGRFLLQFLEFGALMEHEFVNTILAEIAFGEYGIPLPEPMRIDALNRGQIAPCSNLIVWTLPSYKRLRNEPE